MLACEPGRTALEKSGVLKCRYLLYWILFLLVVFLQDPVISEEARCTKSTLIDQLKKSFKVSRLGRARNIKSCIDMCCSRRNCDLALLKRTRCYGISCSHHNLCGSIMNGLRAKRHEISKRSVEDAEDIVSDFSHHPRYHGVCRHRRIVPHHIFLEGGRSVSKFHRLARDVSSIRECNHYCCQRAGCSLAFIMRDKCYGVICPDNGHCEFGKKKRVPLHLEIALLPRRGSFGDANRIVDSDHDQGQTMSERRGHHDRQDGEGEDDRNHYEEQETHQPKRYYMHHHHHHGQTLSHNLEDKERNSQPDQESDQMKAMRDHSDIETTHDIEENTDERKKSQDQDNGNDSRYHKHDRKEENQDNSRQEQSQDQGNEDDNRYHKHYRKEENQHSSRQPRKEQSQDQDNEDNNRYHKHYRKEESQDSSRQSRKEQNQDQDNEDDDRYHDIHRMHHHHQGKVHDNSHGYNKKNDDDEEQNTFNRHRDSHKHIDDGSEYEDNKFSGRHNTRKTTENKNDKMDYSENTEDDIDRDDEWEKKHKERRRHRIAGNNDNDEIEWSRTERGKKDKPRQDDEKEDEDIMEFGDKYENKDKMNQKKFHRKHDKAGLDSEHERRNEDNENKDENNDSKDSWTKNKHRHEDVQDEMPEEKRESHHKGYRYSRKGSLSTESRRRNKEIHDESDDEGSLKTLGHKSSHREADKDNYDKDMDEDFQVSSKKKKKDEKDEQMDEDEVEDGKHVHHRKEENEMSDYNHNHPNHLHHHHHHHEEDEQANVHEYQHHKHPHNSNNADEYAKEKTEQYHQHHHHQQHQQQENQKSENTKRDKKEQEEIHRHSDVNEMKSRDKKVSRDKMSEHYHNHHEKTREKDQEMNDENEDNDENLDNDNIMSHNYEKNEPQSHQNNHNHDDDGKKHHHVRNEKKADIEPEDEKEAKHHYILNKENHESLKKKEDEEKEEKRFKNINGISREKEIMDKHDKDENSEDKGDERNTMRNEEDERDEPKSKVHHFHHQVDKDNDDRTQNTVRNEEDKTGKNEDKESINMKDKVQTSKHKQDYDEINDNDSKEGSKKKSKDDEPDENRLHEEKKDKSKAHVHYDTREREGNLHEESKKDHDNLEEKTTKHINHINRKHNEDHNEKETKNNQESQIKKRKSKQEFDQEESSKNTGHTKHRKASSSMVIFDHGNTNYHQNKISDGELKDTKSNTHKQLKHKLNNHEISKKDHDDGKKKTDDRDFEDNSDDAKHNPNYNSKVSTHHKHRGTKKKKHHKGESHTRHFDSGNNNHDTDEKTKASKSDKSVREESRPRDTYNDYKKSDHEDHGKEKTSLLPKDTSDIKSDKNSHASFSHNKDHKDKNDNDEEHGFANEHRDHKKSKNNGKEIKDDENSFDHKYDKDTKSDKGDPDDDQGKDGSRDSGNRKSKTIDTDGIRRNHVDQGKSFDVEKEHTGNKEKMDKNKDKNGDKSETTEEKKENLERKVGGKNGKNVENMTSDGASRSKDIISSNNKEMRSNFKKNSSKKATKIRKTKTTTPYKHKKLINKIQDNHEQKQTETSKEPAKHGEAKDKNDNDDHKDKGETSENQKRKVAGRHKNQGRVRNQNGSTKTNENDHSNTKKDQNNSLGHINANTENNPGVIEKKQDKHDDENIGKVSEIKDIMDSNGQDESNTGYTKHKPSLYHSLNDLKENNTEVKTKENTKNSGHDIMQSNHNYTKSKNPVDVDSGKDKTKFFNQETSEWKESFKGDQVDESGKYFNQRTRDWSMHQPKTNTGYFHNLTSQWSLKNKKKHSDFGKYFNQRTRTWLGHKVDLTPNKNSSVDTLEKMKAKLGNTLKMSAPIKGKKVKGTGIKIASSNIDKKKKHNQKLSIYNPQLEHKLQPTNPQDQKGKPLPLKVIHNNSKVSRVLNHSRTSGRMTPTKVRQNPTKVKNAPPKAEDSESAEEKVKNEILKLIGEAPDKTTPPRNFSHRLINKHLKPSVKVSSHNEKISTKKAKNIPQLKHLPPPTHQMKPDEFHTAEQNKILINKLQRTRKKQKVLAISNLHTKVKSTEEKHPYEMKINSLHLKSKGKDRASSIRKQKIRPQQPLTKPIRQDQPLAIPIKQHSKLPETQKKPKNGIYHVRKKTVPIVNAWKGTIEKPLYTPTVSSIRKDDYQHWDKQNVFDNEWNNANWNSYYNTYGDNSITQTPTVKPTLSWNMAWNSNNNQETPNQHENVNRNSQINRPTSVPVNGNIQLPFNGRSSQNKIGGVDTTHGVLAPTLPPQHRQGDSNRNGEEDQRFGDNILVPRPTLAPYHRLREFPSPENSDMKNRLNGYWQKNVKNRLPRPASSVPKHTQETSSNNGDIANKRKHTWNQNVKTPYEGQVGRNPSHKATPRRNHVYYSNKHKNQGVSNLTHNNVTMQPKKQAGPKLTRLPTFVQPLGNVTSGIPTKKAPDQPVPNRNNYLKQDKVPSPGKMNSSQVQPSSKTIPIRVLETPTEPPRITLEPNQWNKTLTTDGIKHPFKVEKIESLHGDTTPKDKPRPKDCYPAEIMSEMTLENGLDAGNYTNLGQTELMDSCITKCCAIKSCEVAIQMDNVCFAVKCYSKESCKIKSTLGKSSHHKLCFISRKKRERQNVFDFDNGILGEQDLCHEEQAVGLKWKTTNAGSFDEIPCPKKAKGLARRKCSIESHWLLPDFTSCVTNEYEELYQRGKRLVYGEDSSSLLQSLAVVTTRTIDNSLIFGGDLKKTTEVMTSIVQEQGARQDERITHENIKNYLVTCSNLLDDSNKQEWRNIQKDARGSADILRDSLTYALLASSKLAQTNATYVTNNIVVQIGYHEKGTEETMFPDYTNTDVALWDGERDNIRLPASVFSIGDIKTVTFSYKTLSPLLPMDSNEHFRNSEPNSKILATIVEPRIQDKITPAVKITLHHLKQNRANPRCVFWDFNLNPNHGGAWSTEGCTLQSSTKEYTECHCNHLANFAVLMDVVGADSTQDAAKDERYAKERAAMWFCIPVLIVLVIAVLYIASTWKRRPRRRTLSEKSSLLRSSITTDEVRYDYSTTPSHNLKSVISSKLRELERKNELDQDSITSMVNMDFDKHVEMIGAVQEMEHDSGIESNGHDDSHCDLSLSQETLDIREDPFRDDLEDIRSPHEDNTPYTASITDTNVGAIDDTIRRVMERRIFATNLRRCCGQDDLSSSKKIR